MKIQESAENYLEVIFMLSQSGRRVRGIDIAKELDYTKPSVSVAMKNLRENGYITVDGGGLITLTETGLEIAKSMYARHTLITKWLVLLGVHEETAANDACKLEHVMSEESFEAIKKHMEEWQGLRGK